jgi:hypothetical protein
MSGRSGTSFTTIMHVAYDASPLLVHDYLISIWLCNQLDLLSVHISHLDVVTPISRKSTHCELFWVVLLQRSARLCSKLVVSFAHSPPCAVHSS